MTLNIYHGKILDVQDIIVKHINVRKTNVPVMKMISVGHRSMTEVTETKIGSAFHGPTE